MSRLDGNEARKKRARTHPAIVAHHFAPGNNANPLGAGAIPKDKRELYREARRLALDAAPAAMMRAIELALHSTDERVATINIQTVLDRAGVRAIDKPEPDADKPRLDLARLSREERDQLEAALRKAMGQQREADSGAVEIEAEPAP